MTRRERLERKLDNRREWAGKAVVRSRQRFAAAGRIADNIPLGQPILVGHHSEKHAQRDAERIHSNMSKGVEEGKLAQHHSSKADGLETQLERSVFSDDDDAVEQLRARIAENEAKAARYGEINKAWRKAKGDDATRVAGLVASDLVSEALAKTITETMRLCPWMKVPLETTNIRARIRSDRDRIAEIELRRARTQKAEDSGGVLVQGTGEYVSVTFAEKPDRSVLDELKLAGFRWGGGRWVGLRSKLPASVIAQAAPPAASV